MAVVFEYQAAHEIDEALHTLAQAGDDAKFIAGGQSLMPLINLALAQPSVLIDINNIKQLDFIQARNGSLTLGALARHSTAEHSADVQKLCPLLAEVYPLIGDPQVRNRGTIGGSLSHADPVAEIPTVAVCLGATIKAQSAQGTREISAADFFVTYLTTALQPHELVTEVSFPVAAPRTGSSFRELVRRQGDFAIVAAAATIQLDASGACTDAHLALAGVGPVPLSADSAAAALKGQTPTDVLIRQVAEAACQHIDPESDVLASAQYRRDMAPIFARRALTQAFERATQS